jgi:hypothetical protein
VGIEKATTVPSTSRIFVVSLSWGGEGGRVMAARGACTQMARRKRETDREPASSLESRSSLRLGETESEKRKRKREREHNPSRLLAN